MRPSASSGVAIAVVAAAVGGCGGSGAPSINDQLIAASQRPWAALIRHNAQGFCDAVTPTFSAQFLAGLRNKSGTPNSSDCRLTTTRQLRDVTLVLMARLELAQADRRWLQHVTVRGAQAMVTFGAHKVSVSEGPAAASSSSYEETQSVTITDPGRRPINVDLIRGSDGRWRLTTRRPLITTVARGASPPPGRAGLTMALTPGHAGQALSRRRSRQHPG